MSQVPFQPSPFQPIVSYEAPGVLFSQLLEGEATLRGGLATLFDSSRLSPVERDTIAARIKKASGDNSIVGALTDIALNPFVWLFAVTSPVGATALKEGGSIFLTAAKHSAWIRENAPVLHQLGGATAMQTLRGTPMTAVASQAATGYARFLQETVSEYGPELADVLKRHGLPSLDYRRLKNSAQRVRAEHISRTLEASLSGLDRTRTTRHVSLRTEFFEVAGDGTRNPISFEKWRELSPFQRHQQITLNVTAETSPALVAESLDLPLQEMGALPLRDKIRAALDKDLRLRFGKDGLDHFEVDEAKVVQQWRATRNPIFNGAAAKDEAAAGLDLAHKLLGPELSEMVREGVISSEDYVALIKGTFEQGVGSSHYFPRNTTVTVLADGSIADPEHLIANRQGAAFRTPGSSIPRVQVSENYHPDELEWLRGNFRGTPALDDAITKARQRLADNAERGRATVFQRMGGVESLEKHFRNSAEAYAWHLQSPNDEVKAVLRQSLKVDPTPLPGHEQFDANALNPLQQRAPINSHLDDVPLEQQPGAGFNLADATYQSFALSPSRHVRDTILHVVIPGATGRSLVRHTAMRAVAISTRQQIGEFADSRLGRLIEKQGKWGEEFIHELRHRSLLEVQPGDAPSSVRYLSHLLYASHLGLNMSSVIMNATQPWLWGASFLGVGNVARGYGKALEEMGSYFNARAAQGFARISETDRAALVRKHFKWSDVDGEDFLGIAHSIEENLDPVTFSAKVRGALPSRSDRLFNFLLRPFEKTEWLNRSVMAHATEAAHRAVGIRDLGLLKSDVRQAVAETQFGSTSLNTPMGFLTDRPSLTAFGRAPTVPLARQFLTFPIRSLTTLIEVAPRIGRGERVLGVTGSRINHPVLVAGHDVLRGMAISAVGYELGKNLLGADISRGLFAASVGQLPAQVLLDRHGGTMPVPPILDISAGFGQFFTTGDLDVLRDTVPRVIPGGLALSRALGVAPRLPEWASALVGQKTYANWGRLTADGKVAIFKSDGSLIDYQHPGRLILRAMGADLGRFQTDAALDKFLLDNRDEMLRYRSQYIRALTNGDTFKAKSVAAEYEKRMGLPLTVTKDQIRAAQRLAEVPRTERILDRLPQESRPHYQAIVAQQPSRFDVPREALTQFGTSRQRDPYRSQPAVRLHPAAIAELRRQQEALRPLPDVANQTTFAPFESY